MYRPDYLQCLWLSSKLQEYCEQCAPWVRHGTTHTHLVCPALLHSCSCALQHLVHAAVSVVLHDDKGRVQAHPTEAHQVGVRQLGQQANLLEQSVLYSTTQCADGKNQLSCRESILQARC